MYYVYAFLSLTNKDLYIGYSHDLKQRFEEHNSGQVQSTKSKRPWKLVYYEAYNEKNLAIKQEMRLKRHAAKNELRERLGLV